MALNVWDQSGTLNIAGKTLQPGGGPVPYGMFEGTLAQLNSDLATLSYTAPAGGGSDTITIDVWNQGGVEMKQTVSVEQTGGSSSGFSVSSAAGAASSTQTNSASTSSNGASGSTTVGGTGLPGMPTDLAVSGPASLSVAPGQKVAVPGLSVTDSWGAANSGAMALNVWDQSGTLSVAGQTIQPGGGPVAHGMFQGSLAQLNADLASLTFTAGASGGSDSFTVDVWNQAGVEAKEVIPVTTSGPSGSASAGSGPTSNATSSNAISIASSNASPVELVSNSSISATAGDHMVFIGGTGDAVSLTGGTESVMAFQGGNSITTGSGNDSIRIAGSGNVVNAGAGTNTISDSGSNNTIVLPSAGGNDVIQGYVLQNGDTLDLRSALSSTSWDGTEGNIGKYLSVTTVNNGAVISLSNGSGSGSAIATLQGSGPISLATLLQHATT
jgi:hypothetical protein